MQSTLSQMPLVLITRPLAQSKAFSDALQGLNIPPFQSVQSPLFEIKATGAVAELSRVEGVVFTSANGAAVAPDGEGRPAFCVGEKTAQVARVRGFDARFAQGTAPSLIEKIKRDAPKGPLLHLRGALSVGDVAGKLTNAGIETHEVVVYDQVPKALSFDALTKLRVTARRVLPVFSPATARQLCDELKRWDIAPTPTTAFVAISSAVADVLSGYGMACSVAQSPNGQEMLRLVAENIAQLHSA